MRRRFLLDTNIISEPLRLKPAEYLIKRLKEYQTEIAIASVVWHELQFGCSRQPASKKRARIEEYLSKVVKPTIPILDYDSNAAHWHAIERARLTAIGKTPAFTDGQIAAIAKVNGLTLVTLNTSDFIEFQGITVTDWR